MSGNEVLTTAQVAGMLSVSPGTIRTWKLRNPKILVEGTHWLRDKNDILTWTRTGIGMLSKISRIAVNKDWIESIPQNGKISPVFYLIQLVPELSPLRVKLGFSAQIRARLATFMTICPTAKCVKTWYCLPEWEQIAITSVTRIGCKKLSREVFDCDNLKALFDRCNQFFSLMPQEIEE